MQLKPEDYRRRNQTVGGTQELFIVTQRRSVSGGGLPSNFGEFRKSSGILSGVLFEPTSVVLCVGASTTAIDATPVAIGMI